ncbi:aldolase/citrate lyase family protein [Thermoflexus sp.]|uniref:aldolase/citrate lyase family protein n=1 Tax=Thermoflexus sp. TaxID=1969742 RepID=UPI0035E42414
MSSARSTAATCSICAAEGVDVIFIGPNDLAASMGLLGTNFRENPAWEEAIQTVLRAAQRARPPPGREEIWFLHHEKITIRSGHTWVRDPLN